MKNFDNEEAYRKRTREFKFESSFLESILTNIPENGIFLDIGCGTGVLLNSIAVHAKEIGRTDIKFYGIDPSQKMIETAQDVNKDNEVKLFCGGNAADHNDLESAIKGLGLDNETKFDYIFFQDVLFFFDDVTKPTVLTNLKDMLNPKGLLRVVIREPRDDLPKNELFQDITLEQLRLMTTSAGFSNFYINRTDDTRQYGNNPEHQYYRIICTAQMPEKVAAVSSPQPDPHVESEKNHCQLRPIKGKQHNGTNNDAL